ncbi:MAG: hypothetical protein EKK53_12030 [Burkholderiales bacterium]|nr:MAG: hypothetical protein EKK53_12030 [Burkholderiales bacterium]
MNRLAAELQRLYPRAAAGSTQVLRLEVAAPADWAALGGLWRGVQADLGLPAPAIAVSGTDGLQLWFSLQQPVGVGPAADFLARLQARYLPDLAPARVRRQGDGNPPAIPAQDPASGNWSAFVAPDLAPVFADTPWLDIEPGADGQADLLARLSPIAPAAFDAALRALQPAAAPAAAPPASGPASLDPRAFLQRVLDDESAPLALRVEAAKALLTR